MSGMDTSPRLRFGSFELLGVGIVLTGSAAAAFAPILSRAATEQVGGGGDALQFLWNIWWVGRSLFEGHNPWLCDQIFLPLGSPMVWQTTALLPSSLAALAGKVVPILWAYNAMVFVAYPLGGLGAYVLARQVTGDRLASLVGALAFMACPYMASKLGAHANLLYGGALLPWFTWLLLRATSQQPGRSALWLALLTLAVLLCSTVGAVFCANVAVAIFLWRWVESRAFRETLRKFLAAVAPAVLVSLPYVAMIAWYTVTWHLKVAARWGDLLAPDGIDFAFPFTRTSIWSRWVAPLGFHGAQRWDDAVYVGWLVLPLALFGLWAERRRTLVPLCAAVLLFFLAMSPGAKLLHHRKIVTVSGIPVRLPFTVWRRIPVLGSNAQSGRYMVLSYMMMGVGIACAGAAARRRLGGRAGQLAPLVIALAVGADYGFTAITTALPAPINLVDGSGRVLDPRWRSSISFYYQVENGRPLVGGYATRNKVPPSVDRLYREEPGTACLFFQTPPVGCGREEVLASLHRLGVTDLLVRPGSYQSQRLARWEFRRGPATAETEAWALPQ